MSDGEVADRPVQCGAEWAPEVRTGAGLDLAGGPTALQGPRPQLAEQHGLADASQPGEHEAAFRSAAGDPLEQHVERVQLAVPAGELGRALTGAGGEGIAHGVHSVTISRSLALTR